VYTMLTPMDLAALALMMVLFWLSLDRAGLSGFFLWCATWLCGPLWVAYRLYRGGFLS